MWEKQTTNLTWWEFPVIGGDRVYIRLDRIEAFGKTWVQTVDGRKYEGIVNAIGAMQAEEK